MVRFAFGRRRRSERAVLPNRAYLSLDLDFVRLLLLTRGVFDVERAEVVILAGILGFLGRVDPGKCDQAVGSRKTRERLHRVLVAWEVNLSSGGDVGAIGNIEDNLCKRLEAVPVERLRKRCDTDDLIRDTAPSLSTSTSDYQISATVGIEFGCEDWEWQGGLCVGVCGCHSRLS